MIFFLDETGTTTKMTRLRGRANGASAFRRVPRRDGLTAPWVIDLPMNRETFDTYVETQLAPTLRKGDGVILDNFSSHKSAKAEAILKRRGAWFLFLPPYSPDLNPIEMPFAKPALSEAVGLKVHLRRIGARTIDASWMAVVCWLLLRCCPSAHIGSRKWPRILDGCNHSAIAPSWVMERWKVGDLVVVVTFSRGLPIGQPRKGQKRQDAAESWAKLPGRAC